MPLSSASALSLNVNSSLPALDLRRLLIFSSSSLTSISRSPAVRTGQWRVRRCFQGRGVEWKNQARGLV
jgi:hypothetical protein